MSLKGVSKQFGHNEALRCVDVDIHAHEITAIVGDNGAGKTTLVHVIAGLIQPDAGHIELNNETVTFTSPRHATQLGVAAVFQNPEFCDNLDVAANLFLGNELTQYGGVRDDDAMHRQARQALDSLSASISASRDINSLSGGQRQSVAIARTLLRDPHSIVLDEPTASLSVIQTAEVLDYLVRLRRQGRAIVMVCHNLPDVFAVSDRIIVMRRELVVGEHLTAQTTEIKSSDGTAKQIPTALRHCVLQPCGNPHAVELRHRVLGGDRCGYCWRGNRGHPRMQTRIARALPDAQAGTTVVSTQTRSQALNTIEHH
ncbi:ABC transporter, ATP-binding protein [Bifidobacterium gallicum DSM 20093 = LMG 11596]|nr:ABC transporter, ATP-binding protein [Bifidobacterium gallicum DSM 20093 = LMG 11596]